MFKNVRLNRGVTARDVATIALHVCQARDLLDQALDECGGKIKTPFMDGLFAEMRRLDAIAFSLESDFLTLAGQEYPNGHRDAPLFGGSERLQPALDWLKERGL